MGTKTVTLGQVLDAMEKNGYRQAFDHYFEYTSGGHLDDNQPIIAACAIGQAAINLGVRVESLDSFLGNYRVGSWGLNGYIADRNDARRMTPQAIALLIREYFELEDAVNHILDEAREIEEKEYKTA